MNPVTGTVLIPMDAWRLVPEGSLRECRWRGCAAPGVYELNRGRWDGRLSVERPSWWAYCAEHTYGNVWLEGAMWYPTNLRDSGWRAELERMGV